MKSTHVLRFLAVLGMALVVAGCGLSPQDDGSSSSVRLMTHDSFDISQEVLDEFTAETGITVEVFKSGDGGEMLNKAILAKSNPLADVIYGIDNTFLSRALDEDVLLPYDSPALSEVPAEFQLDPQSRALPVDYGDVCLNYDIAWFNDKGLEPPTSLDDLASADYAGLTVVENPATSTPGLAFLLTTISAYGEDGYLDYWQTLRDANVLVVDGWEQAYYEYFTAASEGDRPIVVSYASSPAAAVYYAEEPLDSAPTAAVLNDNTCFRQIEFTGILSGTPNEAEARQLVNFLLGKRFQEDIPLHMFVYPVNETAVLPDVFTRYASVAENPATLDPELIEAQRQTWIEDWTNTVLR
ncbi:MAG: thiamine ABC transporter substrate-binding protein [Chloroflexota bacterium]